jgi:hypothetical protein
MTDMITEKGISDSAWCPILWQDTAGNSKRVKPGRDWDPMANLKRALVSGENNKAALVRESGMARFIVPYANEFWIHIPTLQGKLLITCKKIWMDPHFGDEKKVTLIRSPKYDPRTEDHVTAENHLHQLIAQHLVTVFDNCFDFEVITEFPTHPTITTLNPKAEAIASAEVWAEEMLGMYEGSVTLIANTDRCLRCWWKKECGAADLSPPKPVADLGIRKRTTIALD